MLKNSTRIPAPAAQLKIGGPDRHNGRSKPVAMLSGVGIGRFPRPDTGRWNPYRAEPGQAKIAKVVTTSSVSTAGQQDIAQAPYTGLMVAEPIARLVSILPHKDSYHGQLVNVPELIAFLITAPLPLPIIPANMVPLHEQRQVYLLILGAETKN